jgi:hypothetical protein
MTEVPRGSQLPAVAEYPVKRSFRRLGRENAILEKHTQVMTHISNGKTEYVIIAPMEWR